MGLYLFAFLFAQFISIIFSVLAEFTEIWKGYYAAFAMTATGVLSGIIFLGLLFISKKVGEYVGGKLFAILLSNIIYIYFISWVIVNNVEVVVDNTISQSLSINFAIELFISLMISWLSLTVFASLFVILIVIFDYLKILVTILLKSQV